MAPFYLSYIICNGPVSVEKFVSECCSRRSYASHNNISFLLYRLGHIDIFLLSQQLILSSTPNRQTDDHRIGRLFCL